MNERDKNPTRAGVERAAKLLRDSIRNHGGTDPGHEACRDRVAQAVTRGNNRRANNNR